MRRAVTLIETLAAVVLLGLVASVLTVGLGSASDAARITEAVSLVRDLDQRARTLSQSAGAATLRLQHRRVWVESPDADGRSAIVAERWTPAAIVITLGAADGAPVDDVRFDWLGRSSDYLVDIAREDRAVSLRVSGLTGWIEEAP